MTRLRDTEIFIHIGYHKTGSTFLQWRVFPELKANFVSGLEIDYIALAETYDPERFVESLASQFRIIEHDKTILSQETLSGRGDGNTRWDQYPGHEGNRIWDKFLIADRLKQTFPHAKILIVIRNQLDYILSVYAWKTVIRGIERRSLPEYLKHNFEERLRPKLSYDKLVQRYVDLFGREKVLVLPFEMLAENQQKYVGEILSFLGAEARIEQHRTKENVGLRNRRLIFFNRLLNYPLGVFLDLLMNRQWISRKTHYFVVNNYFLLKTRLVNPLLSRLPKTCKTDLAFDSGWICELSSAFSKSNRLLSELTGLDLKHFNYPL